MYHLYKIVVDIDMQEVVIIVVLLFVRIAKGC